MNLQAGNPNLMQKALRVNQLSRLESFTNTTGVKAHAKVRGGFVPTPKDPNAVPSPQTSTPGRTSSQPKEKFWEGTRFSLTATLVPSRQWPGWLQTKKYHPA